RFAPQALDQRRLRLQLAVDDLQGPLGAEAAGRPVHSRVSTVPEAPDELVATYAGAPELLDVYHRATRKQCRVGPLGFRRPAGLGASATSLCGTTAPLFGFSLQQRGFLP